MHMQGLGCRLCCGKAHLWSAAECGEHRQEVEYGGCVGDM